MRQIITMAWLLIVLIMPITSNPVSARGGGFGGNGGGREGGFRGNPVQNGETFHGGRRFGEEIEEYKRHFGEGFRGNNGYYPQNSNRFVPFHSPYYVYPPAVLTVPQANYGYYCQNPEGYYPNIQVCPDGWQQTLPQTQTNYEYYCPNPAGYYPDVEECPSGWLPVIHE